MKCQSCGNELRPQARFCSVCGKEADAAGPDPRGSQIPPPPEPRPSMPEPPVAVPASATPATAEKKKRRKWPLVLLVFLLVALAGTAGFFAKAYLPALKELFVQKLVQLFPSLTGYATSVIPKSLLAGIVFLSLVSACVALLCLVLVCVIAYKAGRRKN